MFLFMWKRFIKDYFNFSKKERTAVLLLLTAIILVVLLPYLWLRNQRAVISTEEVATLKKQVAQLTYDSPDADFDKHQTENNYARPASYSFSSTSKATLFYFDPNQLSVDEWKRLGLRDKTIATIQNYRSKGGRFRKPEDLARVYGLHKNEYERLLPYIQIPKGTLEFEKTGPKAPTPFSAKSLSRPLIVLNINTADTSAFIALPGIGSKLANRIINFREKLGGFYSIDQVTEIYGLADSTFQKIKPALQCVPLSVRTINVNTDDVNTLKQHPYIKWSLANAIVQYRQQHGPYQSLDDLLQIAIITPELFQKLKPYLVVQ
jgi:competence protein ComEA